MSEKVAFWGTLDVSARTLEEIPKDFQSLYDAGHHRMRPDDVKRMKNYLTRIRRADRKISATLKMFDNLNIK